MSKYLQAIECILPIDSMNNIDKKISSVSDMFCFYLGKSVITNSVGKVFIIWNSKESGNDNILNIAYVYAALDINAIIKKSSLQEQRKEYLQAIVNIIDAKIKMGEWIDNGFYKLARKMEEMNYCFSQVHFNTKRNKGNMGEAKVFFEYSDKVIVFLDIKHKNEIYRYKLLEFVPAEGGVKDVMKFFFASAKWEGNTFLIIHSNKRDYWKYDLEKKELDFVYPRAECGDLHGQFDLGMMYLQGRGVLKDEKKGFYWLKESEKGGYKRAIKMLNKLGEVGGNG